MQINRANNLNDILALSFKFTV